MIALRPTPPVRCAYVVAPAPSCDRTCESCDRRDAVQVVAFRDGDRVFYVCAGCTP